MSHKHNVSGIAAALFTPIQERVLGLLFGQPERRFQSAEIIRRIQGGTGAVHRQLGRLADAGLVAVTRVGNQKHYQADPTSPVFTELHGLALKTVGLASPLEQALAPLAPRITAAFLYGAVAEGRDTSASDVDLLIISETLTHRELTAALEGVQRLLGRAVQPMLMTPMHWRVSRTMRDTFVDRVGDATKIFLVGSARDLP